MTGLTVVEYLLADEGPGDGGVRLRALKQLPLFASVRGACTGPVTKPGVAVRPRQVCIVPASHKANMKCPSGLVEWEEWQQLVTELHGRAGDAIIFS
eukprot:SAG31_NODE_906_length_11091_cov_22.589065_12_plen_97_part_00